MKVVAVKQRRINFSFFEMLQISTVDVKCLGRIKLTFNYKVFASKLKRAAFYCFAILAFVYRTYCFDFRCQETNFN